MVGRRGPVQAAFTNPELLELGELAGADVIVDPADLELDARECRCARGRHERRAQPRGAPRVRGARARGQAEARRPSFPALAGRARKAHEHVEAVELVRNRLEPDGRGGLRAVVDRRAETLPAGIVFRSVGYRGVADSRRPVRRGARHDPERRRPRARRGRRAGPRRLRDGLDQARPLRRDRHEQEGRHRDGRACCSRTTARAGCRASARRRRRRRAARCARDPAGRLRGLDVDRRRRARARARSSVARA